MSLWPPADGSFDIGGPIGSAARRLVVGWSLHAIRPLRRGPAATKFTEASDDP